MKLWQFLRFTNVDELPLLAQLVEECGYHGVMLADHLAFPRTITSVYPYAKDGKVFWDAATPWPDPLCSIAAMATVTRRICFSTCVYVLPLRSPFDVARSAATLSVLSTNRYAIGAGTGWMKEEFDLQGVEFTTRGKRLDEMISVLRLLWSGKEVEYHGEHFDFPPLQSSPKPPGPVPIYLGGGSKPAIRRAAQRADGWITGGYTLESLRNDLAYLQAMRREAGRLSEPFCVIAIGSLSKPETLVRLEELGVTDFVDMPDMKSIGPASSLEQKIDYIRRYADRFVDRA